MDDLKIKEGLATQALGMLADQGWLAIDTEGRLADTVEAELEVGLAVLDELKRYEEFYNAALYFGPLSGSAASDECGQGWYIQGKNSRILPKLGILGTPLAAIPAGALLSEYAPDYIVLMQPPPPAADTPMSSPLTAKLWLAALRNIAVKNVRLNKDQLNVVLQAEDFQELQDMSLDTADHAAAPGAPRLLTAEQASLLEDICITDFVSWQRLATTGATALVAIGVADEQQRRKQLADLGNQTPSATASWYLMLTANLLRVFGSNACAWAAEHRKQLDRLDGEVRAPLARLERGETSKAETVPRLTRSLTASDPEWQGFLHDLLPGQQIDQLQRWTYATAERIAQLGQEPSSRAALATAAVYQCGCEIIKELSGKLGKNTSLDLWIERLKVAMVPYLHELAPAAGDETQHDAGHMVQEGLVGIETALVEVSIPTLQKLQPLIDKLRKNLADCSRDNDHER